jgi:hypothetical protein
VEPITGAAGGSWVFRGWSDASDPGRILCRKSGFHAEVPAGSTNTLGNDRADLPILGGYFLDYEPKIRTKMLYVH